MTDDWTAVQIILESRGIQHRLRTAINKALRSARIDELERAMACAWCRHCLSGETPTWKYDRADECWDWVHLNGDGCLQRGLHSRLAQLRSEVKP